MIKDFASENNMTVLRTSAKTGKNCKEMLQVIGKLARSNSSSTSSKTGRKVSATAVKSGSSNSENSPSDGDGCCVVS